MSPGRKRHKWTEKEKDIVRRYYRKESPFTVAARIGLGVSPVRSMAHSLGVAEDRSTAQKKAAKRRKLRPRERVNIDLETSFLKYVKRLRENPPRLICWLRGGVNQERAETLKNGIEQRERRKGGRDEGRAQDFPGVSWRDVRHVSCLLLQPEVKGMEDGGVICTRNLAIRNRIRPFCKCVYCREEPFAEESAGKAGPTADEAGGENDLTGNNPGRVYIYPGLEPDDGRGTERRPERGDHAGLGREEK